MSFAYLNSGIQFLLTEITAQLQSRFQIKI